MWPRTDIFNRASCQSFMNTGSDEAGLVRLTTPEEVQVFVRGHRFPTVEHFLQER